MRICALGSEALSLRAARRRVCYCEVRLNHDALSVARAQHVATNAVIANHDIVMCWVVMLTIVLTMTTFTYNHAEENHHGEEHLVGSC